jgi:hypothetical protein
MAKISDVIEGLQILAKYCDPDSHDIAARHDEIYAGPDDPSVVTEDDAALLRVLGWNYYDDGRGWMRFV